MNLFSVSASGMVADRLANSCFRSGICNDVMLTLITRLRNPQGRDENAVRDANPVA